MLKFTDIINIICVFLHIIYITLLLITVKIIINSWFCISKKQKQKHEPENIQFLDSIKLVSLSKSIAGIGHLEK